MFQDASQPPQDTACTPFISDKICASPIDRSQKLKPDFSSDCAQGVLRMGQQVEIRPGIIAKDSEGRATCKPILSRIVSLKAEQNDLQYAVPGGLIGVGTTVRSFSDRICRTVFA